MFMLLKWAVQNMKETPSKLGDFSKFVEIFNTLKYDPVCPEDSWKLT